jgi:hypothetical protein
MLTRPHTRPTFAATALCACVIALSPLPADSATVSRLVLSADMLSQYHDDLEDLYGHWISPFNKSDKQFGYGIPHDNSGQVQDSEQAIAEGFARFCAIHLGVRDTKKQQFGNEYNCSDAAGTFIGVLSVTRYEGNILRVKYDSPKQIARRNDRLRKYDESRAKNGPTGWLVTSEGRVPFVRLGNLKQRHLLEVEMESRGRESVPIEEVRRITFREKCCDIDVLLADGQEQTLNEARLAHRTNVNELSHYGLDGLPVVVIDAESGQPYTRLFSNLVGIKSIEIDAVKSDSRFAVDGEIATTLKVEQRAEKYAARIRKEATSLYDEARAKGWLSVLPDGQRLTPELSRHLRVELGRIGSDPACRSNPVTGVLHDLDDTLRCQTAFRESLIAAKGYSLAPELTPLSTIIIVQKLRSDLR